jgi:hypothetical protein
MLTRKRVIVETKISSITMDDDEINQEIKRKYEGCVYANMGLVTSVDVIKRGLNKTGSKKNCFIMTAAELDMEIFVIPKEFIISNAVLKKISNQSDNNSAYIFECEFTDVSGKKISGTDSDGRPRILGIISTMNKVPESIKSYKHLMIDNKYNLVCKNTMKNDTKKNIVFNCDLILEAKPKYFVYYESINTARINALVENKKLDNPLFAAHGSPGTVEPTVGKKYSMTIYGFKELTDSPDELIDFIKNNVTVEIARSNSGTELIIGEDIIGDYLYCVMMNWKSCV